MVPGAAELGDLVFVPFRLHVVIEVEVGLTNRGKVQDGAIRLGKSHHLYVVAPSRALLSTPNICARPLRR